jgi:hypothetical protein
LRCCAEHRQLLFDRAGIGLSWIALAIVCVLSNAKERGKVGVRWFSSMENLVDDFECRSELVEG